MPDEDSEAFEAARLTALTRFAYLVSGDLIAAQDFVQSALTKAYVRWRRIDRGKVEAYVRARIVKEQRQSWRRRWRGERRTAELPEQAGRDALTDVDNLDVLRRALMQLPVRQRATVVLRYLDDLSEAATAEELGCSVGTVKSQTARALRTLRVVVSTEDVRC